MNMTAGATNHSRRRPVAIVPCITLFALIALAHATLTHIGQRVFPIYELPTPDLPDLHDGTLEDWEEVLPEASLNQFDFRASTSSSDAPDASDLAWRVFLAWHDVTQRLFVAVERIDDVLVQEDRSFKHYADNFVDGVLIPCNTDDSSGKKRTAVRPDSWARIKAAFR